MTYLPDVNVWIALAAGEHVHHRKAATWFHAVENDMLAFCRVTQMGFLRLLTNAHVMLASVFSSRQAWHLLDQLMQDERIIFVTEPSGLEERWRQKAALPKRSANVWTDTYLAAFAEVSGHTLVSFDRDFRRYRQLSVLLLTAEPS